MRTFQIRSAVLGDLPAIEFIENSCFSGSRRSSRRVLKHSLQSHFQSVWVVADASEAAGQIVGAMTLYHYRLSLRIYSLAVLPAFRESGLGRRLVLHALERARATGRSRVSLEADRRNQILTDWYEQFGFKSVQILNDYYSPGRHAVRMRLLLSKGVCGGCS